MALSNDTPAPTKPLMAGCQQEPYSVSSEESEDVSLSGWQVEVCHDCEDGTWIIYYGERAPEDDNGDDENSFWHDKNGTLDWLEGSPLPDDVREAVIEVILRQNAGQHAAAGVQPE